MRFCIITAMWKRHNVVRLAQEQLAMANRQIGPLHGFDVVIAGSEGEESQRQAESQGGFYLEVPNEPLGAKFNAALEYSRQLEPDAVVVMGSDNVSTGHMFKEWAKALEDGADFCGILDSTQWWPGLGRFIHWHGYGPGCNPQRAGETGGSGRCYSKALLDRLGWKLWQDNLAMGLDNSATKRMRALTPKVRQHCVKIFDVGIRHSGIKTDVRMSGMPQNSTDLPGQTIVEWYGDVGERMLRL